MKGIDARPVFTKCFAALVEAWMDCHGSFVAIWDRRHVWTFSISSTVAVVMACWKWVMARSRSRCDVDASDDRMSARVGVRPASRDECIGAGIVTGIICPWATMVTQRTQLTRSAGAFESKLSAVRWAFRLSENLPPLRLTRCLFRSEGRLPHTELEGFFFTDNTSCQCMS